MKNLFQGIGLIAVIVAAFGLASCDREAGPGTAEVRVINEEGLTQEGVVVRMFCTEPGCIIQREGRTNSLGVHTEMFELPVVLRVRAVRYDTTVTVQGLPPNQITRISVDSVCGDGFVQVENDEVVSETITILECN